METMLCNDFIGEARGLNPGRATDCLNKHLLMVSLTFVFECRNMQTATFSTVCNYSTIKLCRKCVIKTSSVNKEYEVEISRRILKIQGTVSVQCYEAQTTFHDNLPVRSEFIAFDSQAWWPHNSVLPECRPALGHIQPPLQ